MTDTVQIPMGVTVDDIQVGLPPREEAHGNGRVFLRAVF